MQVNLVALPLVCGALGERLGALDVEASSNEPTHAPALNLQPNGIDSAERLGDDQWCVSLALVETGHALSLPARTLTRLLCRITSRTRTSVLHVACRPDNCLGGAASYNGTTRHGGTGTRTQASGL